MDSGKRPPNLRSVANSKLYMDLKDIIREHALPFLPAKSLVRFLTVCRDWKLQISAPFFHHNQSLCCRAVSGIFLQTPESPPCFVPIDPPSSGVPDPTLSFLPEPVDIRSSSNGLLCSQGRNGDRCYYLCNPVTQQWIKLPQPTANHGSDPALVLIFEPSLLNFVPEFKIICAFRSADFDDAIEFDIYSSRNNSWNVSGEICFGAKKIASRTGVHVNGVVYWNMVRGGILSFDLIKDRAQTLENCYYGNSSVAMGTFNGKLCKVSSHGSSVSINVLANIHTNTMQMNSREKMWDMVKSVTLNRVLGVDAAGCKVVCLSGDILVVACGNELYSYDFKSEVAKALGHKVGSSDLVCLPYVNSLVAL